MKRHYRRLKSRKRQLTAILVLYVRRLVEQVRFAKRSFKGFKTESNICEALAIEYRFY
ncbi:hypothetical protein [Campylobacter sp.]|uniref:hypothetical protein n=1 Tax=Campylobacter sp. TaxID=205 RepID=UPI00292FA5A5|nr:hypothetical protein [Campylobacter sp.]